MGAGDDYCCDHWVLFGALGECIRSPSEQENAAAVEAMTSHADPEHGRCWINALTGDRLETMAVDYRGQVLFEARTDQDDLEPVRAEHDEVTSEDEMVEMFVEFLRTGIRGVCGP